MHRRLKFLILPVTVAALAASLLTAVPAQAAPADTTDPYYTCGGVNFLPGTNALGYFNNSGMYNLGFPCDVHFDPTKPQQPEQQLLNHWTQASGYLDLAEHAWVDGDTNAVDGYESATKALLITDITAYAAPMRDTFGATDQSYTESITQSIDVIRNSNFFVSGYVSNGPTLSKDRLRHVYLTLLYFEAAMKHDSTLAAIPGQVADGWELLESAYGFANDLKLISSSKPEHWGEAGRDAASDLLEIPNLYTVYQKALHLGSAVASQVQNVVLKPTFQNRISTAVTDTVNPDPFVRPTPKPAKPAVPKYNNWALTNNSFGPLHLMTSSTAASKFTTISYSAYLKRFGADQRRPYTVHKSAKYFRQAYTQLFPGNNSIMVQFTVDRDSRNFGKDPGKWDYSKASVDAITILSTGNAKKDKALPRTNHGVGLGSTYAQVKKAYQMTPDGSSFGWVYDLQDGRPVGKNKDKTATSIYDSDTYRAGNLGNEVSFRFHSGKVVGIRIASNLGGYDDVPWDAAQNKRPLMK